MIVALWALLRNTSIVKAFDSDTAHVIRGKAIFHARGTRVNNLDTGTHYHTKNLRAKT